MHPVAIFAGLFLLIMSTTLVLGYAVLDRGAVLNRSAVLNRGQAQDENASSLIDTLRRIGRAAPVRLREANRLRQQLSFAGYRSPSAEPIYAGIRVASAAIASMIVFGIAAYQGAGLYRTVLTVLCAALAGYMLPHRFLKSRIQRRSAKLREGLPPALDLMVLGLEAGQSLDAMLIEACSQLRDTFPELYAELSMVEIEIIAGKSRAEALRDLAGRNQEIEISRFARLLLDADRFGTSLAPALRAHVHYLRVRTRQKAHEAARKVAVKMVFPLFFLIFPSILLVTLGPAVLQIVTQLRPMLNNSVR